MGNDQNFQHRGWSAIGWGTVATRVLKRRKPKKLRRRTGDDERAGGAERRSVCLVSLPQKSSPCNSVKLDKTQERNYTDISC